jgi:hypothetical protein
MRTASLASSAFTAGLAAGALAVLPGTAAEAATGPPRPPARETGRTARADPGTPHEPARRDTARRDTARAENHRGAYRSRPGRAGTAREAGPAHEGGGAAEHHDGWHAQGSAAGLLGRLPAPDAIFGRAGDRAHLAPVGVTDPRDTVSRRDAAGLPIAGGTPYPPAHDAARRSVHVLADARDAGGETEQDGTAPAAPEDRRDIAERRAAGDASSAPAVPGGVHAVAGENARLGVPGLADVAARSAAQVDLPPAGNTTGGGDSVVVRPVLGVGLTVCLDVSLLRLLGMHIHLGDCARPPSPPRPPVPRPPRPPSPTPPRPPSPKPPPAGPRPPAPAPPEHAAPIQAVRRAAAPAPPVPAPSAPASSAPASSTPAHRAVARPEFTATPHRRKNPLATLMVLAVLVVVVSAGTGIAFFGVR